jgi:hypothetical protein
MESQRIMVTTTMFSKVSLLRGSRGRIFFSIQIHVCLPAFGNSLIVLADLVGLEEDPGMTRSPTSMVTAHVFAVYVPLQAPGLGTALLMFRPTTLSKGDDDRGDDG